MQRGKNASDVAVVEKTLAEIVYRLVKEYGLNVYYDGSFDLHNESWIEQMPENMNSHQCRGVLAFLNDKYATSYATLMELMHSQTFDAADDDGLPIIPVNLDNLHGITGALGDEDTGLGKKKFSDEVNINAKAEQELFEADYELIKPKMKSDFGIYRKNATFTKKHCSKMMRELLASKGYNTNMYSDSKEFYDKLVTTIKNACGESVFGESIDVGGEKGNPSITEKTTQGEGDRQPKPDTNPLPPAAVGAEIKGADLKEFSKYPSTKGSRGREKVSYAWEGAEYERYLSMRGKEKDFAFVTGNKVGIRAFYQFMLWFMVEQKVEIGSLVYGIDKNDVDKDGRNRGLRKWKDVLCVPDLDENIRRLIGVQTYPNKYAVDEDGDLCVYVGGNLESDNRSFAKMFQALESSYDISKCVICFDKH